MKTPENRDNAQLGQLSIDSIQFVNARQIAVALQQVTSLAVSGGSALARLATGERLSINLESQLQDALAFLHRINIDIERYRNGIAPGSEEARIYYHPRKVLESFLQTSGLESGIPEPSVESAAEKLELDTEAVRASIETLLSPAVPNKQQLADRLLGSYQKLSAPYLNVSLQATEEFLHNSFAVPKSKPR
ncbi:hypothetical protein HY389_01070 [Candidatus Daviesbacteria bacterium]|nr:hypothetical protein [Candidatus Daviesbacteria bacterium]